MFLLPRSRICPVIHLYRVDSWPFVFCFGSESNTLNSVARGFSCLGGGSAFRRCRCPFDALRHCGILHTHSFIRSFARSFTHFICYFPAFPALRPGRSSTLPGPALESAVSPSPQFRGQRVALETQVSARAVGSLPPGVSSVRASQPTEHSDVCVCTNRAHPYL